jgi:hypothetical protein
VGLAHVFVAVVLTHALVVALVALDVFVVVSAARLTGVGPFSLDSIRSGKVCACLRKRCDCRLSNGGIELRSMTKETWRLDCKTWELMNVELLSRRKDSCEIGVRNESGWLSSQSESVECKN